MHRSFKITLPADTNAHGLFDMIVGTNGETGITGAIPTDGIMPDRVSMLEINADSANASSVTLTDLNSANTSGKVLNGGDNFLRERSNNTLCLKEYKLKGSVGSEVVEVEIEAT